MLMNFVVETAQKSATKTNPSKPTKPQPNRNLKQRTYRDYIGIYTPFATYSSTTNHAENPCSEGKLWL